MFRLLAIFAVLITAFAASPAFADVKGQAVRSAEVYTSPGRFPIVGRLTRGDAVKVASCTKDKAWCEIGNDDVRGWVLASTVEVISKGKPVR